MHADKNRRHTLLSWLFLLAVASLGVVLGVLQYRWIGEVSVAERDRLRAGLQTSLRRLGQDFNTEITAACSALFPAPGGEDDPDGYAARYIHWKESSRHARLFRSVSLVNEQDGAPVLLSFDSARGAFVPTEWPAAWSGLRDRFAARLAPRTPDSPPPRRFFDLSSDEPLDTIELPRFTRSEGGSPFPFDRPRREQEFSRSPRDEDSGQRRRGEDFGRSRGGEEFARGRPQSRDRGWLLVQLDLDYVRSVVLPELVHRHLAGGGRLDYDVEIIARGNPSQAVYRSSDSARIGDHADASAAMFELQLDQMMARRGPPFRAQSPRGGPERGRGPGRAMFAMDRGRWDILVRHHAGSLETLVAQTRRRNLAVTMSILLLMMAAIVALVRFTQRSQRLARLEMDFVAGVSHELRTPLSVIRTAAHNLSGGVVSNPRQVARYGGLIEQEAERLTAIVEQVLRFAGGKAGRAIGAREPVRVESLVENALDATRRTIDDSGCTIETKLDESLPPVFADPVSLSHALQNLLSNAAKYGAQGGWIGLTASLADGADPAIEIRVADRGPGIPADEISQIFQPFYRGKRAVEDQIHGTGLGLNLVRRIVEAHQGTVTVSSEPGRGTEFLLRIPAAAPEQVDALANTTR